MPHSTCPCVPKFVVVWQEVANLAILPSLEDLFQQILFAEAISIQNTAPKKKLPPSKHLLADRKETVRKAPLALYQGDYSARLAKGLKELGQVAGLWWLGKRHCLPPAA
jgi:hypothetical protein